MKKPVRDSPPGWGRSKSHVVNVDQGLWSGIHEALMKSTCLARFRRATMRVALILQFCLPFVFGQAEPPTIYANACACRAIGGKREIVLASAWNDPEQLSQPRLLESLRFSQKVDNKLTVK